MAPVVNKLQPAINTALAVQRQTADIKNINAQTSLTGAQERAIAIAGKAGDELSALYEYAKTAGPKLKSWLQELINNYQQNKSGVARPPK